MRVLIACEYSGIVRDAFISLGHDAMSCDILQTESHGPHHIGDVLEILDDGWDLMIAHPPCTYLSNVGNRWNAVQGRDRKRAEGAKFFMSLYNAKIPMKCIENPVGYMNTHFRKPDQIIHPYQFGDNAMKRTCLWLVGLPTLTITHPNVKKPEPMCYLRTTGKAIHHTEYIHGGKERSKFWPGIAMAMAEQWGSILIEVGK